MSPAINKKAVSPISQLIKNKPGLIPALKEGSLIEVSLIKKAPRLVYFDVKGIGTAVLYGAEFLGAKNIVKNLAEGESVSAKIINPENEDGFIEISLTGAQQQKVWQELKNLKDSDEVLTVKIVNANQSGLIAEINEIKAFLPVSQLSNENYPRVDTKEKLLESLKKFVGRELAVKIIDLNPRTNKLIISEREVAEQNVKELLAQYKVGDAIEGIISGVADFGAFFKFADNPAIEGLIHISELDHKIIDNPKEAVKADDSVKAKIIEIKDGRVFLSLKALKADPWEKAEEKFKEGQEVDAEVYKFSPFGAVINLEHELQGIIHVSEFGNAEEMQKQLKIGGKYQFIIDSIKPQERRIFLKLKKD
jgi:small subunit ribosomal protein S1